jgi:hypothetical protein
MWISYLFNANIIINKMKMLEIQSLEENIIIIPYQYWMYKEKTKIRYNFAEDTKRTWNRIKQPAGQARKINLDIFADHYSQNWKDNRLKLRLISVRIL